MAVSLKILKVFARIKRSNACTRCCFVLIDAPSSAKKVCFKFLKIFHFSIKFIDLGIFSFLTKFFECLKKYVQL